MATRPYRASELKPGLILQEIKLSMVCETQSLPPPITSALDLVSLIVPHTRGQHRETFFAIPLNTKHRPIGIHVVSVGTASCAIVHPREVFLPAVLTGAAALAVAHNHPSGDPCPSSEDRLVTDRLRKAGEVIGIELLDHIVVGDTSFFSFAADKTLPFPG